LTETLTKSKNEINQRPPKRLVSKYKLNH